MTGEPGERLAERLPGRDRLGVDRGRLGPQLPEHERLDLGRRRRRDRERADAAQLLDRLGGLIRATSPCRASPPGRPRRKRRGPSRCGRRSSRVRRAAIGLACTRRRSRRRRGRRSRSRASRTPARDARTGRRSSRASSGRAGRAGSCRRWPPGRRPRGTRRPPSPPRRSPRRSRSRPSARTRGRPCRRDASRAPCRGRRRGPDRASRSRRRSTACSGTGAGWPWIGEPKRRSDSSCSSLIAPIAFNVAYRAGAAWPFESTNRSFAGDFGSSTSNRRWSVNSTDNRCAHDSDDVGWPDPPRSWTGCCRRRSARRGRSRVGSDRPSCLSLWLVLRRVTRACGSVAAMDGTTLGTRSSDGSQVPTAAGRCCSGWRATARRARARCHGAWSTCSALGASHGSAPTTTTGSIGAERARLGVTPLDPGDEPHGSARRAPPGARGGTAGDQADLRPPHGHVRRRRVGRAR